MKKSMVFWGVLVVVFCGLVTEHIRTFAVTPFEFKPNWLTIIPVIAIWAALIGVILRKDLAAPAARSSAAKTEPVAVRTRTPLADLA